MIYLNTVQKVLNNFHCDSHTNSTYSLLWYLTSLILINGTTGTGSMTNKDVFCYEIQDVIVALNTWITVLKMDAGPVSLLPLQ
jgi:hypothetical protein